MISINEIKNFFRGKISLNEKLAPFTTFRIGGVADYYIEPADDKDTLDLIRYVRSKELPIYVMGNGSNILISDEGIRGVVINLESGFSYLRHDNGKIISGAGVKMAKFVDYCIRKSYAGVEMLATIPATIGGALIMNAGCYGGEIAKYINRVKVIRDEAIMNLTKDECGFSYRNSGLKNSVVLEAEFELPTGITEELNLRRKELTIKRNESQPVEIPNAGCIFKNPEGTSASKLIDECGLKGMAFGGAAVSTKHANFILNLNNATANDVIELIKIIRKSVQEKKGIDLELEVKPIGFEEVLI